MVRLATDMRGEGFLLALLGSTFLAQATNTVFPVSCDVARPLIVNYLNEHGISVNGPNVGAQSANVNRNILDSDGKQIDILRARREFAVRRYRADWLTWSPGVLRSRGFLTLNPIMSGCAVDLKIGFGNSGTVTFIVIFPVDGSQVWQSNGRLEQDYLKAITAALPRD